MAMAVPEEADCDEITCQFGFKFRRKHGRNPVPSRDCPKSACPYQEDKPLGWRQKVGNS